MPHRAVALALLVMIPRLVSPQFGLLDDGLTLQTGREVIGRWSSVVHLIPETGRFFPAYWLVYTAVFGIVGARPLGFFAVNVLMFAALLAILIRLVRLGGGTGLQAWVAAVLFALGGPAVETFYTLSKAEPLQTMWIGISLLATAGSAVQGRWAGRAGLAVLAAVALGVAYATKETTVALIPVSLGWLAIERWSSVERGRGWRFAGTFLAINLVAAVTFAGLRWLFAPLALAQGGYTRAYSLDVETVGATLFRISAWLVRDFAFLLPLVPLVVLSLVGGRLASRRLVLYACVWMGAWLAVYLPWPATFEYYLLPFAFGAAALTGAIVGDLWRIGVRDRSAWRRYGAWSTLVASGLLWALTVANAVADARVQLVVDRANADLVEFLARLPGGSRVVVNTPGVNEYVYELPLHLSEIKRRPDILVGHIGRPAPGEPPAEVFVVTPELENRPVPTVRVALDEPGVSHVNARLGALLGGRGELVYRGEQRARLLELGLQRLLCRMSGRPLIDPAYCPTDRGLIYWRTFSCGWQVHRLPRAALETGRAGRAGQR